MSSSWPLRQGRLYSGARSIPPSLLEDPTLYIGAPSSAHNRFPQLQLPPQRVLSEPLATSTLRPVLPPIHQPMHASWSSPPSPSPPLPLIHQPTYASTARAVPLPSQRPPLQPSHDDGLSQIYSHHNVGRINGPPSHHLHQPVVPSWALYPVK